MKAHRMIRPGAACRLAGQDYQVRCIQRICAAIPRCFEADDFGDVLGRLRPSIRVHVDGLPRLAAAILVGEP